VIFRQRPVEELADRAAQQFIDRHDQQGQQEQRAGRVEGKAIDAVTASEDRTSCRPRPQE
jgi:hypothetical protein